MREKILIADDEECIRYTFADFLSGAGYQVESAETLSQCISAMQRQPVDLLFLDIEIGEDDGIEAIEGLKVLQPECAIVIITGRMCPKTITKARRYGALDYLVKPVHQASLLYITQKILTKKKGREFSVESMGMQQRLN